MILAATRIVLFFIMVTPHVTRSQGSDTPDPVGRFISDRSRMAPPSKEECDKLFLEMSKGSDEARKELIERHIRLVASIALKFRQTNVQMEDIMAEGIQGLVVALDKFDYTRGIKLSTYAAWWIRQRIQRLIGKMSGAVAVPHDVSQGKRKEGQIRSSLQVDLGRLPTDDEVNDALGQDRNLTKRVKFAPTSSLSMDEPLSEDSDSTLADLMTAEEELKQSYREDGSLSDDIGVALSFLDQRERKVLSMRFGMEKGESMKLDDIADSMNVSGERVRQLESLGLRKLRAVLLNNGKLDFRKLDQLVSTDLRGKTKMSPLELSLISDSAA
ncbi:MAG: sigma-70 family RNA polymerase sigma factor [Opitutae bacterium]|nr:sigma-70 family RNA polymerase sigma factor [Opitutae bacterium]